MRILLTLLLSISTGLWAEESRQRVDVSSKLGQSLLIASQAIVIPQSEAYTEDSSRLTVGKLVEALVLYSMDSKIEITQYNYPDKDMRITTVNYVFFMNNYSNYVTASICFKSNLTGEKVSDTFIMYFIKDKGKPIKVYEREEANNKVVLLWKEVNHTMQDQGQ